jgi:hypothetical protein
VRWLRQCIRDVRAFISDCVSPEVRRALRDALSR